MKVPPNAAWLSRQLLFASSLIAEQPCKTCDEQLFETGCAGWTHNFGAGTVLEERKVGHMGMVAINCNDQVIVFST